MRYKIDGITIRSENAAKPCNQKSQRVDSYLCTLSAETLLDFGCGKLRYSDTLVKISPRVTFLDSLVQINREQLIRGERTTVANYIRQNYPNCHAVSYEDVKQHALKYDLITCTNVLSAIPCEKTLRDVISHICRLLKSNGMAVFVNQHRSSYFKRYESGSRRLFGHIHKGARGYSYYGIVGQNEIEELLKNTGFRVLRSWRAGESTFTEATHA